MGKIILLVLIMFLHGCASERLEIIEDVELLSEIPRKSNETEELFLEIIPKGQILIVGSRHYAKDFLVLEVIYNEKRGFIVFNGELMELRSE
ncbi:hypothetical protein VT06_16560 [Arsukibacterium sp. MJ3]|uniref:hypothetical protein n=1 Tax=Arsukibacterium sp. MJ3 TaxID=1632859 RepID=UPI0006273864|nr:hypothetical protein [Arsukibacterium sp. MJ3]KKO47532.1 hypothetical protein VT06_16560 [Arsukibacterium sp. MJ3]